MNLSTLNALLRKQSRNTSEAIALAERRRHRKMKATLADGSVDAVRVLIADKIMPATVSDLDAEFDMAKAKALESAQKPAKMIGTSAAAQLQDSPVARMFPQQIHASMGVRNPAIHLAQKVLIEEALTLHEGALSWAGQKALQALCEQSERKMKVMIAGGQDDLDINLTSEFDDMVPLAAFLTLMALNVFRDLADDLDVKDTISERVSDAEMDEIVAFIHARQEEFEELTEMILSDEDDEGD